MSKIIRCSYYGKPGEKVNEYVSMVARKPCPECQSTGNTGKMIEAVDIDSRSITEYPEPCKRCHGDGWLDNQVKFNHNALTCASNDYPFGTWLRVKNSIQKVCVEYHQNILVMVTDIMASWLNSEGGKYKTVCNKCHVKCVDDRLVHDAKCDGKMVQTRDLDLTFGAFGILAPHSVGLLEVSVEHE